MSCGREKSLRADARRRYVENVEQERLAALARGDTPLSNSPPHGGREQASPGSGAAHGAGDPRESPSLTDRVRALYEGSAVPVREIARIAGVTERTLYKYVAKGRWRRRHACAGRDRAAAGAKRGRRHRPAPGFAPVKGAGGRFIRREDAGKPHPRGIKALEPEAARVAAGLCVRAGALADDAAQAAVAAAQERRRGLAAERQAQAQMRTFEILLAALVDLAKAEIEAKDAWPARAARLAARLSGTIERQMARLRIYQGDDVART